MLQPTVRMARFLIALALVFALGVVAVGAQSGGETVVSPSGSFAITLPAGYLSKPIEIANFGDVLAFGSSQATLQAIENINTGTQTTLNIKGTGGFIGEISPQLIKGQPPAPFVTPLMTGMVGLVNTLGAKTTQPAVAHTFGGKYEGQLATTDHGFVGIFHTDKALLVAIILTDDSYVTPATLTDILEQVTIGTDVVSSGPVSPAHPINPETTPGAPETFRSSDQRVSLDIAADWSVLDRIADQNTLAYGNTLEAAQSRLASARPDLADKSPISGDGGLVILYPAAQFNVNPQSPDLGPLMTQALVQLKSQGYAADAPIALENVDGGLYAYIEGTEVGYLALIPFGDQIAYVTATGTKDSFDAADDALVAIIESVRSPAAPEATTGLGGLGGLQGAATEAPGLGGLGAPAAPTATVPALGGLTAPNATPEASS